MAVLAILTILAGCAPAPAPEAPAVRMSAQPPAPFALEEATVGWLAEAMAEGRLTSREITAAYLSRIEALDRRGPELRAMLDLNPDALAIADALDAERRAGRVRGPLHGIPVVLKDNIDTADRMTTTAGALALEGSIAPRDAFIVERLRAAGAVILGKTNLSEWANFRSTRSSSGWSGRGGQVRNPYALDRTPCGSSSGSAVAVAANLAPLAVGTETDGSIVCPAATNGVVGIKATIGLVSRAGIIPIAASQDIAGPMARSVADAAALLNALVGEDPRDASTRGVVPEADYTRFLDSAALRGARIGVVRARMTGYHPDTDRLLDAAIDDLRRAGAVVVDSLAVPHHGRYGGAEWTILQYEFRDGLNRYLAGLGDDAPVRSLAEIIAFNERERGRSMPFFGQEILVMSEARGPLTDSAYLAAVETAKLAAEGIDSIMRLHSLDALIAPTGSPAWAIDLVTGDHFLGASSGPAAVAGYPNITVPMGFVHGLPVGLSFFGTAWSEPTLIGLTHAYETATRHRQPPSFLPTAPLSFAPALQSPEQDAFWDRMRRQCGRAFEGRMVVDRPDRQLLEGDEPLIAHWARCDDDEMHVAFHIGRDGGRSWDRSRTWVLTRDAAGLELRHDHRRPDGSPDDETGYGGRTVDGGSERAQWFFFDERRAADGSALGWRLEIDPGARYVYGTVRGDAYTWRLDFDLSTAVAAPPGAWGHD